MHPYQFPLSITDPPSYILISLASFLVYLSHRQKFARNNNQTVSKKEKVRFFLFFLNHPSFHLSLLNSLSLSLSLSIYLSISLSISISFSPSFLCLISICYLSAISLTSIPHYSLLSLSFLSSSFSLISLFSLSSLSLCYPSSHDISLFQSPLFCSFSCQMG